MRRQGAGRLSKRIEEIYGKDGVAFIVDEGGLGVGEQWGRGFAGVATAEKGQHFFETIGLLMN